MLIYSYYYIKLRQMANNNKNNQRQGIVLSVYIPVKNSDYIKAFDKTAKKRFNSTRSEQIFKLIIAFVNKYGTEFLDSGKESNA